MRNPKKLRKNYFNKFSERPVVIKPFDQNKYDLGMRFVTHLNELLKPFKVTSMLRGSTFFKIAGKGDIEVGIYIDSTNWFEVLIFLINEFKSIGNLEKDYARFNVVFEDEEIEVIVEKGKAAQVDQKLAEYLLNSPQELKEYEQIKKKFAYNKRIYQIEKNKFLEKIIKKL